jgi:glycerophosphoryl diester phosphodiesterase
MVRPIGFAHRGARAEAPENTVEAFALALELGATGLESDVWLTADGVAVLDHDGFADGVPIPSLPRASLPLRIPSLEDLYRACGTAFELSLDVKHDDAGPEALRVARAAGAEERLWLCHWNWKRLLPWRERSHRVRLVDSTSVTRMRTPPAERAQRMRHLGIDALNLHQREWDAALRETMVRCGRLAFAWDVQTRVELRTALALGVDAVYCDHVGRMVECLAEHARGAASPTR